MNRPEVSPAERRAAHEMVDWAVEVDLNAQYMPWQRNIGVSDHYPTIRLAQSARKHTQERQHRESVEDLTRRFAALTLNDHNVMNVVRNRSIFRTDR